MSTEILTSGCSFKCQPKIAPLQTSKPKIDKIFTNMIFFANFFLRNPKKLKKTAIQIQTVE